MAKRRSIDIANFKHDNPIPVATRIGPLLVSSVIVGRDPATKAMPDTVEQQCVNIFVHIRAMLTAAGGGPEDIIKLEFWVTDRTSGRVIINQEWLKMFPDAGSRPARHTHAATLGGEIRIQASFMAYIEVDKR